MVPTASRVPMDSTGLRDFPDPRNSPDPRDSPGPRDSSGSRDSPGPRNSSGPRDSPGARDSPEPATSVPDKTARSVLELCLPLRAAGLEWLESVPSFASAPLGGFRTACGDGLYSGLVLW